MSWTVHWRHLFRQLAGSAGVIRLAEPPSSTSSAGASPAAWLNPAGAISDDKLAPICRRARPARQPRHAHPWPKRHSFTVIATNVRVQRRRFIASSALSRRRRATSQRSSSPSAPSPSRRRCLSAFTQLPTVPSLIARSRPPARSACRPRLGLFREYRIEDFALVHAYLYGGKPLDPLFGSRAGRSLGKHAVAG